MRLYTLTTEQVSSLLKSIGDATSVLTSLNVVDPTPVITPEPTTPATLVGSLAEFKAALTSAVKVDGISQIRLTRDIDSTGNEIIMQNLNKIVIDGDGFKFKRTKDQITSNMVQVIKCDDVSFNNIGFDDGNDGVHGEPGKVKPMVKVRQSKDITFDNAVLANAKGYTLYIQEVDGFTYTNCEMYNAGVLGLYVGHADKYSSRVTITHNHFHDNATNALALLGVGGKVQNIVAHNTFERNHIYGRWAVNPKYGTGFTGGGQLYIARADNVLVEYNTIDDGKCLNGYHRLKNIGNGDVTGIELCENKPGLVVTNIRIRHNTITNNDSKAIGKNVNAQLDKTTVIEANNTISDNGKNDKIYAEGATIL